MMSIVGLIGAFLDNRAWRGMTRKFKVRKGEMVRPAVEPFDDGIGGPFQLVMQTTRREGKRLLENDL